MRRFGSSVSVCLEPTDWLSVLKKKFKLSKNCSWRWMTESGRETWTHQNCSGPYRMILSKTTGCVSDDRRPTRRRWAAHLDQTRLNLKPSNHQLLISHQQDLLSDRFIRDRIIQDDQRRLLDIRCVTHQSIKQTDKSIWISWITFKNNQTNRTVSFFTHQVAELPGSAGTRSWFCSD